MIYQNISWSRNKDKHYQSMDFLLRGKEFYICQNFFCNVEWGNVCARRSNKSSLHCAVDLRLWVGELFLDQKFRRDFIKWLFKSSIESCCIFDGGPSYLGKSFRLLQEDIKLLNILLFLRRINSILYILF